MVAGLALAAAPMVVLAEVDDAYAQAKEAIDAYAQAKEAMPEKSLHERLGGVFAICANRAADWVAVGVD
jgi:hemoglobin